MLLSGRAGSKILSTQPVKTAVFTGPVNKLIAIIAEPNNAPIAFIRPFAYQSCLP
jgi:hypothetical protein